MASRNTIQMKLVLDAIKEMQNHPTADEVYQHVKAQYPNIGKATVYRNLQKLCNTGEISKRSIPGENDRYDHQTSNHYHAKCTKCGKVFDTSTPFNNTLNNPEVDLNGFKVQSHDIIFFGICKDCQSSDKAQD